MMISLDKKRVNFLMLVILAMLILFLDYSFYQDYNSEGISIANWNLQVFGQAKAENMDLMNLYADKINNYDIVFIQEIRDSSGQVFLQLCSMLQNYSCISSSRAGRSSYKEQYGVIYRDWINITSFKDFNPDSQDRWERPPIKVSFDILGYELIVYNFHAKPDDVAQELSYLEEIIQPEGNVIVLGDLNADCFYYDNRKQTEFDDLVWVIGDSQDTTSSVLYCAYGPIILNNDAYKEYKRSGADSRGITKEVSDHYLVWVELEV